MVKNKFAEISESNVIAITIQTKYKEKYPFLDKGPIFYFRKIICSQLLLSNAFMNSPVDGLENLSTGVNY